MLYQHNDEETINKVLNDIDDFNKHEALRYIAIGKDKDLMAICKIYETCTIKPSLNDFIKLFNSFLKDENPRRKVDMFKWELFCVNREIPKVQESLKQNIFIVAT